MKNIEKIHIYEFRKFHDIEIKLGRKVTAIAGKNGTMKTTLLGIIGQPFSMNNADNPLCKERTLDGAEFETDLNDKFKFSPEKDIAGHHRWDVFFGNPAISAESPYPVNSILRSKTTGGLRFWHASKRDKGSGFRTFPVIYLSLQRLSPLGESKNQKFDVTILTSEEKAFVEQYHNAILCSQITPVETGITTASNKKATIASTTEEYDAYGISAGQDNVGKILLAILSFKRLMNRHPTEYQGGLLLIDELDAAMYPAAQEKLTEYLYRFASDYKLQIIFTTHSMTVLEKVKERKYREDTELIYLYERGGHVEIHANPSVSEMRNHLNAVARKPSEKKRIKVFCEDKVGRDFAKSLLGRDICRIVDFHTKFGSVSAEHYHLFVDAGIDEFTSAIIILDGDKKTKKGRTAAKKNMVILPPDCKPTETCPEKLFYHYLHNLPDTDEFWSTELDGHTKETCFRDFENTPSNTEQYKSWYNDQKEYWGKGCTRLHKRWMKDNVQEVSRFTTDFQNAYNVLAESLEMSELNEEINNSKKHS